jgi:phosphoribosylformimino-5-aminoimidazole carboxamide ribotide isomerase
MSEGKFTVYPAIDLKGGRVVRLQQGRSDAETVYGDDPAAVARKWVADGARFLHVVDLDGAFTGEPKNGDGVKAILGAVNIPVQLGGGLRTQEQVEAALELGVRRVVLGTKACESPEFVGKLVLKFGHRIVVGIDARDGFVTVQGWTQSTRLTAVEFAQRIDRLGVSTIVFTDVATDGMLTGPNYFAVSSLCSVVRCNVIASGGVSAASDVQRLARVADERPNLIGVIVGKALYDGRVDLKALSVLAGGS